MFRTISNNDYMMMMMMMITQRRVEYALQDNIYVYICIYDVCVLGVPRPEHATVFTSILSGWWGPSGYLYSRPLPPTNCPTRCPFHASARGLVAGREGCRAGETEGEETHE